MYALVASLTRTKSLQRIGLKACFQYQNSRGYAWSAEDNIISRGRDLDGLVSVEAMGQPGLLSVAGVRQQIIAPEQKILVPEQKILVPGGASDADGRVPVSKQPFLYDCCGFKKHKDWRRYYPDNKIPNISDQHGLPTCWANAAASSIEWMHLLKTGERKDVSIQQLIDYDVDNSCNAFVALRRVVRTGIASVDTYPYVDGLRGTMKKIDSIIGVKDVTGWNEINHYNYLRLIRMLQRGPAVVWARMDETLFGDNEMNINEPGIHRYPLYGVPNHMMVCVGYDFRAEPHWILQNSWGKEHANGGYLYYGPRGYPELDDQFRYFPFICYRPLPI